MEYKPVKAPRGTKISCKSWLLEAPLRMLMNNLDPEVAKDPEHLIVYGGNRKGSKELGVLPQDCRDPSEYGCG